MPIRFSTTWCVLTGSGQFLPIMKQGGDTNTIQVVQGIRDAIGRLYDIPKQLVANVVFDQSAFVKEAINTLIHEGVIGPALTSFMILIFSAASARPRRCFFDFAFRPGYVCGAH